MKKTEAWAKLKRSARGCRACDLYKHGTQTVFGEGKVGARLMLVGEQPGDQEDLQGRPFVGPAGKLLRTFLAELEINGSQLYLTNAVKHFKWTRSGKKRLHQKPNVAEVNACHPWLQREIEIVSPKVILCLGATATRSVLGKSISITTHRKKKFALGEVSVFVTWHPSSALRTIDKELRAERFAQIKSDIRAAWIAAKPIFKS